MNIGGLPNLGFQAPAQAGARGSSAAKGGTSTKSEKSGFSEILSPKPEAAKEAPAESKNQAPVDQDREPVDQETSGEENYQQQPQARAQSEAGQGLPGPSPIGGFQGPSLESRGVNAPVNTAIAGDLTKPSSVVSAEQQANSLTRRVVWNEFLRKMNGLGVSAEDVLKAFQTLSKEELEQPAEKSVDKLVMALGLDGQQALMARQYFTELLHKTQSKSIGEELAATQKQVSLTLLTKEDVRKKLLDRGLDKMNRNFFMPDRPEKEQLQALREKLQLAAQPQHAPAAKEKSIDPEMESLQAQDEENRLDILAPPLAAPTRVQDTAGAGAADTSNAGAQPNAKEIGRSPIELDDATAAKLAELQAKMETLSPADQKLVADLVAQAKHASAMAGAQSVAAAPDMSMHMTHAAHPEAMNAAAVPGMNPGMMINGGNRADNSGDDKSSDDQTDLKSLAGLAGANRAANAKGEFQAQMNNAVNPQQAQPMSVPDLVQQAHVMVKDGGGEMKVTLHPDGLGEVAMRVSVNDGKVNVQMITESDEAKRLIEHQIGDLKANLAQNHLHVDSIKIDTATNLGKQLDQQFQNQQRQATQMAWEQFRQDHQGWRRSFFEGGTVNPYRSQMNQPRDVSAPNASTSSRKSHSRRLDLVA